MFEEKTLRNFAFEGINMEILKVYAKNVVDILLNSLRGKKESLISLLDLEHMRDLVVRKLEVSLNLNILEENNEAKALFKEENKINIKDINYEKDTEINNLKNLVDDYKKKLTNTKKKK